MGSQLVPNCGQKTTVGICTKPCNHVGQHATGIRFIEQELLAAQIEIEQLRARAERAEAALRRIDTAANWVGRRNAWNRTLQHVGQPPNSDNACREVRQIVRAALAAASEGGVMKSTLRAYFSSIKSCRCLTHGVTVRTYRDWLEHLRTYHARAEQEGRDAIE